MAVYLDELMALNFLIDYLLLSAVSALGSVYSGRLRRAAAAVFGALYAAAAVIWPYTLLTGLLSAFICGFSMVMIAFGRSSFRNIIRRFVLLMVCGAVFGGFVLLALQAKRTAGVYTAASYPQVPGAVVAALCVCVYILISTFTSIKTSARENKPDIANIRLSFCGKETQLCAMVDTGNHLRDPMNGSYVLICRAKALEDILPLTIGAALIDEENIGSILSQLKNSGMRGFHLIPYRTIGQKHGLLPVFRPDGIWINGTKRSDVVVGVTGYGIGEDEPWSAVIGI